MSDYFRFTILGCGSSGGVPRIGNIWGACDPQNPKNRRRRCALLVERISQKGATTVLIDAGPDLREQLISTPLTALDGVVITHDHADHTHGFDDLRQIMLLMQRQVDVYLDEPSAKALHEKFAYCFKAPTFSHYPPIVKEHRIHAGRAFTVSGAGGAIEIVAYDVDHGELTALALRINGLLYAPDVKRFQNDHALKNLDVLIIDALRPKPHPSHFSLDDALACIQAHGPKRAILTNLHIDLDYETLCASLPPNIRPAYDGMIIELPAI